MFLLVVVVVIIGEPGLDSDSASFPLIFMYTRAEAALIQLNVLRDHTRAQISRRKYGYATICGNGNG